MDPVIIPIIGVTLSIVFFGISYRRTVGARKERIENTNKEIVSKLFNRIIRENYEPTKEEIETYIKGKAIEKKSKEMNYSH